MEIEKGEYIRTKYGIAKIIREYINDKSYFDCYDIDRELDGCNFINDFEILKHSKNIIDLIEVGDYVNGKEAISIRDYVDFKKICFDEDFDDVAYEENIKSVVTKEQFASVKYKVGG